MSDSATPQTIAHQAPLSRGFPRQGHWSGIPLLLQGIFLTLGSNPRLLHLLHWQMDYLPIMPPVKPRNLQWCSTIMYASVNKDLRIYPSGFLSDI